MKIILISPAKDNLRVTEIGGKPKGHNFFRFSMLSLLYVAGCTPRDIELKLVDEHIEAIDFDERADLVAISFMTGLAPRAYQIADEFRRRKVKVAFGGFHATFVAEEALRHADSVCVGEAEGTWPDLIEDLRTGNLKSMYKAEGRAKLQNLNLPRRDLLKRKYYAPIEAVQIGRGCKHRCDFCSVTAFYKNLYCARPVEEVIKEIADIKNKHIIFVDDNIIADPEYAKKLFQAMAPLKKKWVSQASISIANDLELVRLAKRSGCIGLFIGLETLAESNLKLMKKQFNETQAYERGIEILHRHGIGVEAAIVFGFDDDDKKVFERTLNFLDRNNVEAIQVSILTPLPGTPLFKKMGDERRIIDYNWENYDYRHVVIRPKLMNKDELQAGADWVISRFYSPWRLAKRVFRSIGYLGLRNALVFCFSVNFAYLTMVRTYWQIKGHNPSKANSSFGISGYDTIDCRETIAYSR